MNVVAIGSNIEPEVHVPAAVDRLRAAYDVQAVSPFYVTPAIDRPEQPDYWNGVVAFQTDATRDDVRARLRGIEAEHGRIRGPDKWASRTLDLDILAWRGEWADDLWHRPFLAQAVADIGLLPPRVPLGDPTWPVAWKAQA